MEHLLEFVGTLSKYLFIIAAFLIFLGSIRKDLAGLNNSLRRLIGYLGNVETEPKKEQRHSK